MNFRKRSRQNLLVVAALCGTLLGCSRELTQEEKNAPIPPGPYTVIEGDNLSHIALRAYGDMDKWYGLLNANPELCKRPRFDLVVGETIQIPAKDKLDMSLPKSIFPKELPAEYIVMPGDSLHFIAQGCYGDRNLWEKIYNANRDQLSERVKENTRQLIAGQVLLIPAKEENR